MTLLRPQLEQEFKDWLRAVARHKGLTQADVAWQFPYQVHPKTVEEWFRGHATPSYHLLVGLCGVLGELPPSLRGLCRAETPDGE